MAGPAAEESRSAALECSTGAFRERRRMCVPGGAAVPRSAGIMARVGGVAELRTGLRSSTVLCPSVRQRGALKVSACAARTPGKTLIIIELATLRAAATRRRAQPSRKPSSSAVLSRTKPSLPRDSTLRRTRGSVLEPRRLKRHCGNSIDSPSVKSMVRARA